MLIGALLVHGQAAVIGRGVEPASTLGVRDAVDRRVPDAQRPLRQIQGVQPGLSGPAIAVATSRRAASVTAGTGSTGGTGGTGSVAVTPRNVAPPRGLGQNSSDPGHRRPEEIR